jgi:multiple sugar transport system substrate-binding protein
MKHKLGADTVLAAYHPEISHTELDQFLEFIDFFLEETENSLGIVNPTPQIIVMIQIMRSHLRGRLDTPSSLIAASGLTRGTGHRLVVSMIEDGSIIKRKRTASGKSFSLHPSPTLIRSWLQYMRRMNSLLGLSFGAYENIDYFYGASYLSSASISPLPVMREKLPLPDKLRILIHADPTFLAMHKLKRQFEMHFGVEISVHALSLDRLRDEILENAQRRNSKYDIVSCDVCWMEELIDADAILAIDSTDSPETKDYQDFHDAALSTVLRGNTLYGLPVQTVPELLIYRKDLLKESGLLPPQTLDNLMNTAATLNDPANSICGICWNGARGTPVGTTFALIMADFGQPILNLPRTANGFSNTDLASEQLRLMLDSSEALNAAEFLLELLDYSPANVLQMSWYERARCYAAGEAAMAYCYTQILPMIEGQSDSPAKGNTGYLLHPSIEGVPQIAPLGGWNLCVPSNLKVARFQAAKIALQTFTSAAASKLYIEHGSQVSSRFSVCDDPAVAHGRPIIAIVDRMARNEQLQTWPRPAVPSLSQLISIIGEEIHAMLMRNKNPRAALMSAQIRCEKLI